MQKSLCIMSGSSASPFTNHGVLLAPDPSSNQTLLAFKEDMGAANREYEFFVTTDEPHQPHGVERGLIRRLVMRNFFETKSAETQVSVSEQNSASTVFAKKQLKNRFRLSKTDQESDESKSRRVVKQDRGSGKRKRPGTVRTLSGAGSSTDISENSTILTTSLRSDESTVNGGQSGDDANATRRERKVDIRTSLGAHRLDPFDVLPIPGTPQLDILFKLYKAGSRINSIAINTKFTWWNFISKDAGLLHATLATWALYGMLAQGIAGMKVQKLKHKNEAIKEINMKIGSPDRTFSDELVGTVLIMASFENLIGAYDAAQLHIAALKRMVNARGGLVAFGHNDGLIRGMIWVDFHTATAFHTPPSFPRIRLGPDTPALPDELLEEAACTSPTSLLHLSLAAIDCFNIFYRLHRLALAASSSWTGRVDYLTLSTLLYETEYMILHVPDYSRNFLDCDLDMSPQTDDGSEERISAASSASVVEAIVAASQIFVYAALRQVPTNARIFAILLERLHMALARPNMSMIDTWKKERNLQILLWVVVVACVVVPDTGNRPWWIERLVSILIELNINTRFELELALQRVAWMDMFFSSRIEGIWGEVMQIRGGSGSGCALGDAFVFHGAEMWDASTGLGICGEPFETQAESDGIWCM